MALVTCFECSATLSDQAHACPQCGAPAAPASPLGPAPYKSRGIAVFLALFLGGFGAHKFYLDKPGVGVLYLLFFWTLIPSLIAFFEALGYLFMSNDAFQARFQRRLQRG